MCNMTIYVQNGSPHGILGGKTPEEVFTRVNPDIEHLRIFGCPVYIHVYVDKRTKLEPSREKGILVGYNETSKTYRISISVQRNIVVRIYVKFKENLESKKSHDLPRVAENEE